MRHQHDKQGHVYIFVALLLVGLMVAGLVFAAKGGQGGGKGGGGPAAACSDHIDNDGDGFCDFNWKKARCDDGSTPGDSDCNSKDDNDETGSCVADCNSNSDCGTNGYLGSTYCGADGNAYRDYQSFSCDNAGTCSAMCNNHIDSLLWQNCGGLGCFNGTCGTANNETNSTG